MPTYQELRPLMKTGDVIAFSGKGRVSNLIKWSTRSHYSHVAMVLNTYMPEGLGESVLIIESTTLTNLPDTVTREIIKGVQLHWLSRRLECYDGEAWWLPLKEKISDEGRYRMQRWLRQAHAERVPYDTLQAMGAGIDLLEGIGVETAPDFSSLFCSELVARALQIAGILPEALNPSEQTPQDVAQYQVFGVPLAIEKTAIMVKQPALTEEGLALIKQCEGFSATPYPCPGGYSTIGYGHRIGKNERYDAPISEEQATALLRQDIKAAEDVVRKSVKVSLSDNQFSALVSFVYNVGAGAFARSTLLKQVNASRHEKVPDELRRWVFAKGKKLPGLVKRREAEAGMYGG